ncbi:MAG: ribosomal L7Ae/L30e/S12e/Gadd45 family protein [Candidatus Heimdallarchaeota archaeon]
MPKRRKKEVVVDLTQELSKAISMAVRSGQTKLGARTALENAKMGKGKAFVLANNAPEHIKLSIQHYLKFYPKIKLIEAPWHAIELGSMIGRPHSLSVLTIFEPGDSKILELDT